METPENVVKTEDDIKVEAQPAEQQPKAAHAEAGAAVKEEQAEQPAAAAADADADMPEQQEQAAGQKRKAEDEPQEPIKLGYKTFTNADDARSYFQNIIKSFKVNQDLNEVRRDASRRPGRTTPDASFTKSKRGSSSR